MNAPALPLATRRAARHVRALALAAAILLGCDGTSTGSRPDYEPAQPIAFSHAAHAGAYRIDCQYCHFGADTSRHAGLPPLTVCMNCHARVQTISPEIAKVARAVAGLEQLRWVRVHRLAGFVFFDHARHTRAGVRCALCHGTVETMARVRQVADLTMGWCLACHRDPSAVLAPAPVEGAQPAAPATGGEPRAYPKTLTDCTTCHR